MSKGLKKEVRQILQELKETGEFEIRQMKTGHWRIQRIDGTGRAVTMASSPSCKETVKNNERQLARHLGFERSSEKLRRKPKKPLT